MIKAFIYNKFTLYWVTIMKCQYPLKVFKCLMDLKFRLRIFEPHNYIETEKLSSQFLC